MRLGDDGLRQGYIAEVTRDPLSSSRPEAKNAFNACDLA
jgi:hypothetical protein